MLKHIEKQKREAARIRLALKGKFEGGLTYVLIPSISAYSEEVRNKPEFHIMNMDFIWDRVQIANGHDIDEWDIVSDKDSVERLTLECLKKNFGQSQGTPFTTDFWIDTLTNETSQDAILSGEFDLSGYPKPVQMYLASLKNHLIVRISNLSILSSSFVHSYLKYMNVPPHPLPGDTMGTTKCS